MGDHKQNDFLIGTNLEIHPLFKLIEGEIETWEIT